VHPIFLLAVVAAVAAMGIGYLGNDIALDEMVQKFGAGEETLQIPTESVNIAIRITRGGIPPDFKDMIIECAFSSPDEIEKDSMIICKLLDQKASAQTIANVIAEGMKITGTVPPNTTITMEISYTKFDSADDPNSVHDLIIVIKGPPKTNMP